MYTHVLFRDLHTILENGKADASAHYLWTVRLGTIDPVGAKHTIKWILNKHILKW